MWGVYKDFDEDVRVKLESGVIAKTPETIFSNRKACVKEDKVLLGFDAIKLQLRKYRQYLFCVQKILEPY